MFGFELEGFLLDFFFFLNCECDWNGHTV